jgi:hypothetical protein
MNLEAVMRFVNLWDAQDRQILIDMDVKQTVIAPETYFKAWMNERIKWGKPVLFCAAAVTAVSIITMIAKHI